MWFPSDCVTELWSRMRENNITGLRKRTSILGMYGLSFGCRHWLRLGCVDVLQATGRGMAVTPIMSPGCMLSLL
eukprot:1656254-Amphidinium_carterae.1